MSLSSSLLHLPPPKPFLCIPKQYGFPLFKASLNFSLYEKPMLNVKSASFAATRRASSLIVEEEEEQDEDEEEQEQEEEFEAVNIAEDVTQVLVFFNTNFPFNEVIVFSFPFFFFCFKLLFCFFFCFCFYG